jgi:hypothetical protein
MSAEHYTKQSGGWLVKARYSGTRKDGTPFEHFTYWYGPDHGWGTTSGPLDYSAAWFRTKADAEAALRSVYGNLGTARRRGYSVIRNPGPEGVQS